MYSNCFWDANGTFNCNKVHKKLRTNEIKISKRNLKSIYPSVRRIIAIGDVHGDLQKLKIIFLKAKLIKKQKNGQYIWIGKDTYVVQVGDQLDYGGRGSSVDISKELSVLLFMDAMDQRARKHKGRVISLLGNDELMNVLGDFRYVSSKGMNQFGGIYERKRLFTPGGKLAKYLAYNRIGIVQIGKWVFVHGGLLPYWAENYKLQDLNKKIKEYLLGNITLEQDNVLKKIITGENSFFWTREYGYPKDQNYCKKVNKTLKLLNARGMVIGHSIHEKITSDCSNKLWKIDVALSRAFGNISKNTQCLEIISTKSGNKKSIRIIS